MERATLLRSSLACNRLFAFRSATRTSLSSAAPSSKFSSSAPKTRHSGRGLGGSSLLRRRWRLLPKASPSPSSFYLRRERRFASLSPRAVAAPAQSSSEFEGVDDEVAEKFGFEKVSEEFIGECKSKAVLFRHKYS